MKNGMVPSVRMQRLRQNASVRLMLQQTVLQPQHLILPLFVREGKNVRQPIVSMPGQFQFSIDQMLLEVRRAKDLGIQAVILFGIPEKKNASAFEAYNADGIIQRAIAEIKNKVGGILVIADCCLCEYTDHGHCGILRKNKQIDNDATLELLAKIALAQAEAGADIIAPSGMMDGMVASIRRALDQKKFFDAMVMSYSAKYASALYAPFREAAEGAPQFGDRATYQMNPANSDEALRETELDINEGADFVMVKPALFYLDIVQRIRKKFSVPVVAYNVSGEYAMVKAAAKNGFLDEKKIVLEMLLSMRRAGADCIITYHALDAAKNLL